MNGETTPSSADSNQTYNDIDFAVYPSSAEHWMSVEKISEESGEPFSGAASWDRQGSHGHYLWDFTF